MKTIRLARWAMACRFELLLHGDDDVRLRAAGEEALAEISRFERLLSFYSPTSEITRINNAASKRPVCVDPLVFEVIQRAVALSEATGGAFDPTIGPLMKSWGFVRDTGRIPDPHQVEAARAVTGFDLLELDENTFSVSFRRPGVQIDLGGIGKGAAIDEAVLILREAGITNGLLHGGTSSVYGLGLDPEAQPWKIALPMPGSPSEPAARPLAILTLQNEALSVSAVWGKSFEAGGRLFGHVIDPREGRPVEGAVLAAVTLPSATDADAVSTGCLVLGRDAPKVLDAWQPEPNRCMLFPCEKRGAFEYYSRGMHVQAGEQLTATLL